MFAVIETGGKQYIAEPGKKIKIEKLEAAEGSEVVFDKILLRETEGKVEIGRPYVEKAEVKAQVLKQARTRKVIVFKFHSKNRYDKKKTHRQHFTEVEIKSVA